MNEQLVSKQIQFAIKNNVKVELNDRQVNVEALFKLFFVVYSVLLFLVLFAVSAFLGTTFTQTITTKSLMVSGLILSLALTILVVTIYYWFTFVKPNVKFVPEQVEQVVTTEPVDIIEEETIDQVEQVDLTASEYNPYIKEGATWKEIVVYENQKGKLYNIKDLIFPLDVVPHLLIAGETGSSKTTLTFNVLQQIQRQFAPDCDFIVCDYGDYDFQKSSIARSANEITDIVKKVHIVMKGRQREKHKQHRRIILVIEEFEAYLTEIQGLKSKVEYEEILTLFAQLGQMARKTRVHIVGILQSAKASTLPTLIRNNLKLRFILKSAQTASRMLDCNTYKLVNLRPGYSWVSIIDNFVEFPKIDEPELPTISWDDLTRLSNIYLRKYPDLLEEEKDEN